MIFLYSMAEINFTKLNAIHNVWFVLFLSLTVSIPNWPVENQNTHRSFEFLCSVEADARLDTTGQTEQLSQPSKSLERERRRKSVYCDLQRSLAWDSAFFTSVGVLDPEELSSMIEEAQKSGKGLPEIEETVYSSADSVSILEGESSILENIEAGLFKDIRASIQKYSEASNLTSSSSKPVIRETETRAISALKKEGLASQSKMKLKPASGKQSSCVKPSSRRIKQHSGCPQVTQIKRVAGNENSSVPERPKLIGRANPAFTTPYEKVSLGVNRIQMQTDKLKVATKGALASKLPCLGGFSRVMTETTLSAKSSSSATSPASRTESIRSSLSSDSSSTSSSDNVRSTLNCARKKLDFRTVNPSSSGATLKTPLKIALKDETKFVMSILSPHSTLSKLSSSSSPGSSVSGWSSGSLSLTSIINQRSNGLSISFDSSSRKSIGGDIPSAFDIVKHSNNRTSNGHKNQLAGLLGSNVRGASTQIGTLSFTASTKPSGLRMPSPKIGFFDGVKSLARTHNEGMQSHPLLPTGLPKIGFGICGQGGGSDVGRFQKATTASPVGKPASPVPFLDRSNTFNQYL